MVILRATNDNGVTVDLDVLESNQPILLDISAIENATIGDVFGVSSQTFSLPGTDKNNQFFGNLFNLGATPSVALQDSIPCQVLTDGQAVFTGRLYITDIITDQKGYTTYQVNVVNETVDFKFLLTDTYLSQLDWSAYNHSYTYGSITSSWDGAIAGGDIVYPHVDYGRQEGDTTAPTYAFSNNPSPTTFDNSTLPLRIQDFKPAIRVKAVLDTLFDSVGYEYTSSFIESAYFQNLYTLTTPNDGIGVQNENPTTGSFYAYRATSNQTFNALTDTKLNFNAELYDDYGRYDLVNDEFTAYADGQYGFTLAFNFSISNYGLSNRLRFFVTLQDDLGNQLAGRTFVDPPQSGQLISPFQLIALEAGDKVRAFVELGTDDGSEVVTVGFGETATYFTTYSTPKSVINANVDMGEQFPADLKALDFLQGLIEKFNLVIEPVPGTRNVLRIEPFQDWIDQGVNKDWTDKIDRGQRFKIVHPITEQPKEILFSDEEDDDALNQYTVERFGGDVYGTYKYTNDSDLAIGERKIGTTFAATPVKNIPNSTDFIIPMLHKREPGQEPRPYAFKPRLLYANGKKAVPSDAYGGSLGTNGAPPRGTIRGTYFFRDEVGTTHREYYWYQMTTYESLPTSNTSRDLHFGNRKNPGFWPYFQTNVNGYTANSAYHYYWETYINSLYDIDARKLTCNVYLEPTEIQNIALNDKYFIDGAYYRINKINGANLTYRDTVEVELIKQLNRKLQYPRRRVIDALNDRLVDIQVQSEDASGRVVYQDYDTGLPVEDFNLIVQAAAKDGYTIYKSDSTGSTAWDTISATNIPLDRVVSAGNEVDQIVARVTVNGTANKVAQNVTDTNILGTNNIVGAFTDTAIVSGFDNTVDIDQSNVAILASQTSSIYNGTDNSIIIGGSGSYINNGDWVVDINGFPGGITDSDNTVAINRTQNEVIINGNGHTVVGLNLEGAGLDLLNTRENSVWLGDTYLGESIFLESSSLSLGDGTSIDLSDTQYRHSSLYVMTWSGLSPGTASISLPSYVNNDYKKSVYTFKADGTFDGTTRLEISGFSGQIIEGTATYALSSSYDFVTLYGNQGNWLVLNSSQGEGGGGASNTINVQYTGSLVNVADTLNFTGSGVTVTAVGGTATIDITGGTSVSASYATSASRAISAECSDKVDTLNYDMPDPGKYFYTSVQSTASTCQTIDTLDQYGLYYDANTNRNVSPVDLQGDLIGTASFAITASYALNAASPVNIYNSDGTLDDNRTVQLGGNNLIFSASQGESFIIASDPASDVNITNLAQATGSNVLYYNTTNGKLTYGAAPSGSGGTVDTGSFMITGSVSGNTLTFTKGDASTFDLTVAGGGGTAFPYTGSAEITGSLAVTGSYKGNIVNLNVVNDSASLDLSAGNAFTITLTTGSTYISASNIDPNQKFSLLISSSYQYANIVFEPTQFYLPSTSNPYVTSPDTGSRDILTFESYVFNPNVLVNTSITQDLQPAQKVEFIQATGGTITTSGSYKIHTFTTSGTFNVTTPGSLSEFLIVAGGGGGGSAHGGGGGGGGLIYDNSEPFLTATSYTVTVGGGGAGAPSGTNSKGSNGSNSSFYSNTAIGGGGGGAYGLSGTVADGLDGGSGGGGGGENGIGGLGTAGQGFDGGDGTGSPGNGGGGGGASGDGSSVNSGSYAPGGANGLAYDFTGSSVYYAGGGGGGAWAAILPYGGIGGLGGGGNGGDGGNNPGLPGGINTGGGGGGASDYSPGGGSGGSGIVIIKYQYTS